MNSLIDGKSVDRFTYNFAPNLHVITAYFNPSHYQTRRLNYGIFAHLLKQSGIPLLTVECAFGDDDFDLPEDNDVIKVRSKSILWQKERLLNLALGWLPKSCQYVAWLDCDLVFTNPNWARDTAALLQNTPVVQVFETCNRLPEGYADAISGGEICQSFGLITGNNKSVLKTGRFQDHGHTGYGWAARKEILDRCGFYEHAIAGSADHYMAHAACGDWTSPCINRMMMENPKLIGHFQDWANLFHQEMKGGQVSSVPGEILHLWHGSLADRQYMLRHCELTKLGFDPYSDIVSMPGRPLEFSERGSRSALIEWFFEYFRGRREDGSERKTYV